MMGIPSLPVPPPPPPPFPGGRSVPVDPDWNPLWRIPLITVYDADDPLPDWFAKAFRERPGVGTIGKTRRLSTTPAGGAGDAAQNAMFEEIRAQREKAEARGPIEDPLEKKERAKKAEQAQAGGANVRRASDARRGSSADRRAFYESEKTSLSASSLLLSMSTGALADGSRTGTYAALGTQLFASFLVEDAHVREATRRLQPKRATLLDAMEVEVRARAHALDAAPVAASA